MKKKPAKPKPMTKAAPKKSAGGSVSKTVQTAKDGPRTTIPPGATVLLSDPEFSAAVIEAMKAKFDADRIVKELDSLTQATAENKFGEVVTDYRTRLATLERVMQYVVGKPLDRTQNITTTTYSYEEIAALIAHSRELRMELRRLLDPFDGEDGV